MSTKDQSTKAPYAGDLRVMFPGRFVPFDPSKPDGEGCRVYPISARLMREFMGLIYEAVKAGIAKIPPPAVPGQPSIVTPDILRESLHGFIPLVLDGGWDLLRHCVVPDLDELPHFVLPDVARAFIEENFLEERKRNPWTRAIEDLIEKLVGVRYSISEILSKSSSLAATLSPQFSSTNTTASTADPSPTRDGLSPNSTTGSTEPPPTPTTSGPS